MAQEVERYKGRAAGEPEVGNASQRSQRSAQQDNSGENSAENKSQLQVTDMYGFIREGVAVGDQEEEDDADDDFGQRLQDRRGEAGSSNHSVTYKK